MNIIVGEPIKLKAVLRDIDGNLISASSVEFDVSARGVSQEDLGASEASTGIWEYPYTPSVRGKHRYVAKVDGAPREQGEFHVEPEFA